MAEIEYTKNLQSPAQFQRGDSLTVRGGTVTELLAALKEASEKPEFAEFFQLATIEYDSRYQFPLSPLKGKLVDTAPVTVQDVTDETKPPSDIEALANIEKHLGKPASPAQIAVAAKKSGKSVSELQGISEAAAKELIKKGAA